MEVCSRNIRDLWELKLKIAQPYATHFAFHKKKKKGVRTSKFRIVSFSSSPPNGPSWGPQLGLTSAELQMRVRWSLCSLQYLLPFLCAITGPSSEAGGSSANCFISCIYSFLPAPFLMSPMGTDLEIWRNMELSVSPLARLNMWGDRCPRTCAESEVTKIVRDLLWAFQKRKKKSKLLCKTSHLSPNVYTSFPSLFFFFIISLIPKVGRDHLIWWEDARSEKPDCQQSPFGTLGSSQSAPELC